MYGQGPMFRDQVADLNSSTGESGVMQAGVAEGALDFSYPTTPPQAGAEQVSSPYCDNMYKSPSRAEVKYIDKPQRRITEIRIFFDDQTWETFVPKK